MISLVGCYLFWSIKRGNPAFWFIPCQWIIASGTILYIDFSSEDEFLYAVLFLLATTFFIIGAALRFSQSQVSTLYRDFFTRDVESDSIDSLLGFYFMTVLAVIVTYSYYRMIGYNLLLDVLLGRDILDFVTARLATYSGDIYYAPGYVNQFKNALLPLCVSVIIVFISRSIKSNIRYFWIAALVFGLLLALLGTGQRAPMIYALMAAVFSASLVTQLPSKKIISRVLVVIIIFGGFSVLNSRTDDASLLGSLSSLLVRVFMVEQTEGILSFKYMASIKSVYLYEWLEGFMGISPWHKGSYLAHQTFEHLHGTDRGTSAITLVASAYHNGGMLLVVLFYFFTGYLFSSAYIKFLSGRKTILRCFGYGHIFFIFSVFVSTGPILLVNKGMLMFMLFLAIRGLRFRRKSKI
jgi:oligosaccharide repeat unit polymerase